MTATVAFDDSDVEYYFENTLGNGHNSGWITDPNYTDFGLDPNTEYGYRVKARDRSPASNETPWSETKRVTTPLQVGDITPPDPDPMEWDTVADANGIDGLPREVAGTGMFDYSASMRAVVATDAGGGPVEYFFEDLFFIHEHYSTDTIWMAGHIGCKNTQALLGMMREKCRRRDIPLLIIEYDLGDSRVVSADGIKEQVTMFMKTVMGA